jgi:hypothetical protein
MALVKYLCWVNFSHYLLMHVGLKFSVKLLRGIRVYSNRVCRFPGYAVSLFFSLGRRKNKKNLDELATVCAHTRRESEELMNNIANISISLSPWFSAWQRTLTSRFSDLYKSTQHKKSTLGCCCCEKAIG